jgi:hypothetical protein
LVSWYSGFGAQIAVARFHVFVSVPLSPTHFWTSAIMITVVALHTATTRAPDRTPPHGGPNLSGAVYLIRRWPSRRKMQLLAPLGRFRRRTRRPPSKHSSCRRAVEPLTHFLASPEERHALIFNRDIGASARIAAGAGGAALDSEATEAAQLNAVAACHCGSKRIEDDVHDFLNIVLTEMRVLRRNALYELGFYHVLVLSLAWRG